VSRALDVLTCRLSIQVQACGPTPELSPGYRVWLAFVLAAVVAAGHNSLRGGGLAVGARMADQEVHHVHPGDGPP